MAVTDGQGQVRSGLVGLGMARQLRYGEVWRDKVW